MIFLGFFVVRVRSAGTHLCQRRYLVNVKLKWVKDKTLDVVVAREMDLRPTCLLVSIISSHPRQCLPIYHLSRRRRQLGLPDDLKLSTFIRRYPTIFHEFQMPEGGGSSTLWFRLTDEASKLHQEEINILQQSEIELVERLQKLLMLTRDRILPLQTVEQLKWDMGLPYDYEDWLVPRYPQFFSFVRLPDDRIGLKLLVWDSHLAISALQKNGDITDPGGGQGGGVLHEEGLGFPIGFTRGFGLKRKCMEWLEEWQKLPYTSPYADASHLDPRTDVAEKRIVGVFHELLNLTIQKKTERKNMSNLRKPLGLPQKFTKVFGRHPGIFYISHKCATDTVVLREAYSRQELLYKHPLVGIRERYVRMMKAGLLNRSRGLYKKTTSVSGRGNAWLAEEDDEGLRQLLLLQDDDYDDDDDCSVDEHNTSSSSSSCSSGSDGD
ncbi:Plant organelle RNA recognition domain [Macleaya cordata]|uniref:Plant organelle RNA recognition domain n=1 Tax=Macleaya cordata TaxID=56857 RepID=A0A200PYD7_MACCD|nr:Plant organelle RNA recognition domain [Macleaya cordata]